MADDLPRLEALASRLHTEERGKGGSGAVDSILPHCCSGAVICALLKLSYRYFLLAQRLGSSLRARRSQCIDLLLPIKLIKER